MTPMQKASEKRSSGRKKREKLANGDASRQKSKKRPLESQTQTQPDYAQISSILQRISDGFVAFDENMNYTYVNRRGGLLLGRKPRDLIGKNYWKEYPEAASTPFAKAYVRALKTQCPIEFEDYYEPWGRWFENRVYPSRDGLSIFFSDITERKQVENQVKYLSRVYATLSQINQSIVRIKDRQKLFEAVCNIAVKYGQFQMAWIGLVDPLNSGVEIVAYAGEGERYIRQIDIDLKDKQSRKGPTATAILENKVVVVNDVQTDTAIKRWRKAVLQYGYRSLAAVPLSAGGEVVGVLVLYATEADFFTKVERSLLEEIGSDISFALDVMIVEEERGRAQKKIETQFQRLSALAAIDQAITSGLDLFLLLDTFVLHVITRSGVDAAAISIFHADLNELEVAVAQGFQSKRDLHSRIRLGDSCAGAAVLRRRMIHVPDLCHANLCAAEARRTSAEGFVSYYAFPLITKGEIKGVLELFHRSPLHLDSELLDFIHTLSRQSAIAIADAELVDHLKRSNLELLFAYDETIEGWSRALDLRDKETEGHTQRVTRMTLQLASIMNIKEPELVHIRRGALLHDIGKMGVPDHILFKPEPLNSEESAWMRKHPQYAQEMLAPIKFLRPALDIPYCHHEKWDGTGYPRGLKGEEIPLAARIFAIVDVYDALISDRPYRDGWPKEKALEYIREQSGLAFDTQVVDVFLKMINGEAPGAEVSPILRSDAKFTD